MPIPSDERFEITFPGPIGEPVGTGNTITLIDEAYGHLFAGSFSAMPTYSPIGLRMTYSPAESRSSTIDYFNELNTHPGPIQVPNGLGVRFRPIERRCTIEIGKTSSDWYLELVVDAGFWGPTDTVLDSDFNAFLFQAELGASYDFVLMDTGYWCLATTAGTPVLEGDIGPAPVGSLYEHFIQCGAWLGSEDETGSMDLAALWLYGLPPAAVGEAETVRRIFAPNGR